MTFPERYAGDKNGITFVNWTSSPWQMWSLTMLIAWALRILLDSDAVVATSTTIDLNNPHTLNLLAAGIFSGALMSLAGLHMKDREFGIGAELSGYVAILAIFGVYLSSVYFRLGFEGTTRLGVACLFAVALSMIQRSIQIITFLISVKKVEKIEHEIDRITHHD